MHAYRHPIYFAATMFAPPTDVDVASLACERTDE
jgi:hypothetical protein